MTAGEQTTLNLEPDNLESPTAGPVECLGMTFPNDEERIVLEGPNDTR
jgi:hypothetical protein